MTNSRNVWVVVPNWNGADLLDQCLNSLEQQTQNASIVVVDNGSTDNSQGLVEQKFPKIHLIKLDHNTGFSGGVNAGISHAMEQGAEFIALFNNDATADKQWLENLVETLIDTPKAGIVTCKFMRDDRQHFDSVGEFYSIWGMPFPKGRGQADKGQFDELAEVFGATGGASLYRSSMLKEIGLFDEKFFIYYEDDDVAFRAQLAGWKVIYQPKAVAYHQVGATTSKLGNLIRYHSTKNFYMLYLKNMPGWLFWKYLPLFWLYSLRLAVGSMVRLHFLTYLRGLLMAVILLPHAIGQRRKIQKPRKVSLKFIDSILSRKFPPQTGG